MVNFCAARERDARIKVVDRRRRRGIAQAAYSAWIAIVMAAASVPAWAQEWQLNSRLSERLLFNDNLLLRPDHEISAFGSITTPELVLKRTSPTSSVTFDGRFPYEAYFNHSELNSADQIANLDMSKVLSERSSIGLQGGLDRVTNLRGDIDRADDPVGIKYRRTRWTATPSWSYLLSPIDTVEINANYTNVSYDTDTRVDYQTYGPGVLYTHQMSETAQITGSFNYTRFEPDLTNNPVTNSFGATVGYRYTPSERFTIGGAVGLSYDRTSEDGSADDDGFGFLMNLDFRYELSERTRISLNLLHDTEPSGRGTKTARSSANLGLDYKLTELVGLGFDAHYTDNADYFGSTGADDTNTRHFFSLSPSVFWDLTEDLRLSAAYTFRYKSGSDGNSNSNEAMLTLRYALPELHWSGL